MRARHPGVMLFDDASLHASMVATVRSRPAIADDHDGIWLFGYGSLLWNPRMAHQADPAAAWPCVCPDGLALERDLHLVWRREMLTAVYEPRWISLRTEQGRVPAIAFVVNPRHETYRDALDEDTEVELMATGHGMLGTAAEYLDSTVAHLEGQGIHDRRLRRLWRRVAEYGHVPDSGL